MRPLLNGFNDSLDILAFKWQGIRPRNNRYWIIGMGLFMVGFLLITALLGTGLRAVMTAPTTGRNEAQETLVLWINIFLVENVSTAAGGMLWALIGSVIVIPLVGYSFASLIPEGDLASVKVTDNHKITDSILLQFVSSISFIQVIALTALTSVFTIGNDNPGLGIVFAWSLWLVSVLLTVLSAWFFELLHRKFGLTGKLVAFLVIATPVVAAWLIMPDVFLGLFGLGEKYVQYVQGLSFDNIGTFFLGLAMVAVAILATLYLISFVASTTLKQPERVKKKDYNKVLVAKLGLQNKNKINNLSQFLANMILRQNNIWKPIVLSGLFTTAMTIGFYNFYNVSIVVAALIPVMVALVWTINVFGIIGSGSVWLVSLPHGKRKLLSSVSIIHYIVVGIMVFLSVTALVIVHHVDFDMVVEFLLTAVTTTAVVTQFALNKAVYNPHRYRVHIRGESVLPPNKALSYMVQLFFFGFVFSGLSFGVKYAALSYTQMEWAGTAGQLLFAVIVCLVTYARYSKLRQEWLSKPEIMQNIIKTVGQQG